MLRDHKSISDALDALVRDGSARLLYDERPSPRPGVITRRIYKYDETLLFTAENLSDRVVSGTIEMSHAETVGYRYAMFDQVGRRAFPGNCSIELCAVLESRSDARSFFALPVVREFNCTPLGFEDSPLPVLDVERGDDSEHFTVTGSGDLLIYSNDSDNRFFIDGSEVFPSPVGPALLTVRVPSHGSHPFEVRK